MISIELELSGYVPPAGTVVLVNMRNAAIRIWRLGNEWGDEMISFELHCGSTIVRVGRSPQIYTRNVPGSIEVPPGGRHPIRFDLGDGSWQLAAPVRELFATGTRLSAIYAVSPSHEADEAGVWIGHARSQLVPLTGEKP